MVIGVDAGALSVRDDRLKVGVYRVTKNVLMGLGMLDKENHYRLFTFDTIEQEIVESFGGRAEVVELPRRGWQRVWLPIELKKRPVDAFLGFAQALPSVSTMCDIGVVYDLGFLYRPEAYGASARILKKQTEDLIRRADHIIAISHATKADLVSAYGLTGENVSVAYPGVDGGFSPAGEKHVGSRPYVLFVGSLNKAKDIPTLIELFAQWKDIQHDLYFIGGDYWPDPNITETIERLHLTNQVKRLGFVPDRELPKYYRGATALVTAAIREGFCLPATEAMACGTPVVALDRGALRETVGEGGIVIRERSNVKRVAAEFVKALKKITDKGTREKFSKNAVKQSRKYRWDAFAKHVRMVLNHEYPRN